MHPAYSKQLVDMQVREARQEDGLLSERVQIIDYNYPFLYVQFTNNQDIKRLIRFDCSNYDFDPIAVEPVDGDSRELLLPNLWPKLNGSNFPAHHMKDGRPFICMHGTRDYYTHESHTPKVTGEGWEKHRSSMKIADLIKAMKIRFESGQWQ